jgi:hypothetical protein
MPECQGISSFFPSSVPLHFAFVSDRMDPGAVPGLGLPPAAGTVVGVWATPCIESLCHAYF